jgi:putative two-component system response regulator
MVWVSFPYHRRRRRVSRAVVRWGGIDAGHRGIANRRKPHALTGEEIPLSGRIVRLCDVYDALRAARSYKTAMTHEDAVEIILHGDDRIRPEMFDPELLCLFAFHYREFEAAFDL